MAKSTGQDPGEGTRPWYREKFQEMEVVPTAKFTVKRAVELVERGYPQYLIVAQKLGAKNAELFAYILGAIHYKESGCNFQGVLHNGEKIIGTGRKTRLVPKDRGPFNTWNEAALDAIKMNPKRWEQLLSGSKDIGDIAYAIERYNGTGYITGKGKQDVSPYLWDCTDISDGTGLYVSDGKYDPNFKINKSAGAMAILKELYKAGKFKCVIGDSL